MSKGRSSGVVYHVEARSSYHTPQQYAGMLLDQRWQPVSFAQAPAPFGVPGHSLNNAGKHGFLTYEQAQALRWWFHAAESIPACVETRLVAYDWQETWEATERGVSEAQEWPRRPFDSFVPRDLPATPPSQDQKGEEG